MAHQEQTLQDLLRLVDRLREQQAEQSRALQAEFDKANLDLSTVTGITTPMF